MRTTALFSILLLGLTTIGCDSTPDETQPEDESAAAVAQQSDDDESGDDQHADDQHAEGEEPELEDDLPAGETRHFGAEFTIEDDPIELVDAIDRLEGADLDEETESLKVEARVAQVCQKKGCWFTLDDDEVDMTVRVRMKDYGFFVPRNTVAADSVVEGKLRRTMVEEELARHFAEDVAEVTGEDPEEIDGPQESYEFMATGVEMTLPES